MPDRSIIAIIDDDPAVRDAIASLLRSHGYGTLTYGSAEGFVAAHITVDAVLTDLGLPGMSGLDLALHWRAGHPHSPILLMTAFPFAEATWAAQQLGLTAIHIKPLDMGGLVGALRAALPPTDRDQDAG